MPVQSVEALLDDALDAAVREQWSVLAAAGLPSQAAHTGATNAPHITLAVAEELAPGAEAALAGPAAAAAGTAVRLGGLVCFGGRRRVLARLVVPTAQLLDLHAAVARAVDGSRGRPDNLAPGRWTPHVTLARGLDGGQLGAAVALLGERDEPAGRVAGLRRWDGEQRRAWVLAGA